MLLVHLLLLVFLLRLTLLPLLFLLILVSRLLIPLQPGQFLKHFELKVDYFLLIKQPQKRLDVPLKIVTLHQRHLQLLSLIHI